MWFSCQLCAPERSALELGTGRVEGGQLRLKGSAAMATEQQGTPEIREEEKEKPAVEGSGRNPSSHRGSSEVAHLSWPWGFHLATGGSHPLCSPASSSSELQGYSVENSSLGSSAVWASMDRASNSSNTGGGTTGSKVADLQLHEPDCIVVWGGRSGCSLFPMS